MIDDSSQSREQSREQSTEQSTESAAESPAGITCDFCHEVVASVRRVALDREYERLRTPHAVMYSCSSCFEKKERRRVGMERGSGGR